MENVVYNPWWSSSLSTGPSCGSPKLPSHFAGEDRAITALIPVTCTTPLVSRSGSLSLTSSSPLSSIPLTFCLSWSLFVVSGKRGLYNRRVDRKKEPGKSGRGWWIDDKERGEGKKKRETSQSLWDEWRKRKAERRTWHLYRGFSALHHRFEPFPKAEREWRVGDIESSVPKPRQVLPWGILIFKVFV